MVKTRLISAFRFFEFRGLLRCVKFPSCVSCIFWGFPSLSLIRFLIHHFCHVPFNIHTQTLNTWIKGECIFSRAEVCCNHQSDQLLLSPRRDGRIKHGRICSTRISKQQPAIISFPVCRSNRSVVHNNPPESSFGQRNVEIIISFF